MGDLISSLLPFIIAGGGVLLALFQKKEAGNAKIEAQHAKNKQMAETARAELAEETTKIIIQSEKVANKNVEKAKEQAKTRRDRFTNSTF